MDQTPPNPEVAALSRRRVLQSAVVMALGGATANFQPSLAGRGWCRSDPLVLIGGIVVDIFCTAHLTTMLRVTGPTEVVITTPPACPRPWWLEGSALAAARKSVSHNPTRCSSP